MMKKLMLAAAAIVALASPARAMDDAERARQMAVYQNYQQTGTAMVTTTTTMPAPAVAPVANAVAAPVTAPAVAPIATATPVMQLAAPVATTTPAVDAPMNEPAIPVATTAPDVGAAIINAPAVPANTSPVAMIPAQTEAPAMNQQVAMLQPQAPLQRAKSQMSPLSDDGKPLNITAVDEDLGTVDVSRTQQLEAYEAYKAGKIAMSGSTVSVTETMNPAIPAATTPAITTPDEVPAQPMTETQAVLAPAANNMIAPAANNTAPEAMPEAMMAVENHTNMQAHVGDGDYFKSREVTAPATMTETGGNAAPATGPVGYNQ